MNNIIPLTQSISQSAPVDMECNPSFPKFTSTLAALAFAGALGVLPCNSAYAANATWDGSDDSLWSNAANWSASPVPGTGNIATFGVATPNQTVTVDTIGIRQILFAADAAAYTLGPSVGSGTITLDNAGGGAITMNAGANNQLINANVVLGPDAAGSNYTLTNNSTTNSLTLAGNITGGTGGTVGSKLLQVTGAGNVTLSGVITPGADAAVFRLANIGTGVLTLTGSGSRFIGTSNAYPNAGLRASSGTTVLAAGSGITTTNLSVADVNGATAVLNIEGGTHNVTVNFAGVAGNAGAKGTTNQTGGTVSIAAFEGVQQSTGLVNSQSAGTYNLKGGTLNIAGSYRGGYHAGTSFDMNVSGSGQLNLPATTYLALNGTSSLTISGNGSVTKPSTGDLQLVNNGSTGTGILNLDGGTLNARGITTSANTGIAIVNFNGGTFRNAAAATMLSNTNVLINVKAGGAVIDTNTFNTSIFLPMLHDPTLGDTLDGGLTKNGLGTLNSNAVHTYTGATTVNSGTLAVGVGGTSVAGVGGGLGLNSAVTLADTAGAAINLQGNSTIVGSLSGGGASGGNIILGTGGSAVLTTGGNNLSTSYAGAISGIGSLAKKGSGTQKLSGVNTYNGNTTVSEGTLQFAKKASLYNGATASWTAAKITAASGATLALNVDSAGTAGFSATDINTLLTNISVASTATTGLQSGATLGFDTSTATGGTFTQGNAIADSTGANGGAIAVNKLGAGTLTLDKTNTYTGATTVSEGNLLIAGAGSINSSSGVSVNGGTFRYDSSTGLNRNVTVENGAFRYNSSSAYTGSLAFTSGTVGGSNLSGLNLSIGANQVLAPGNSTGAMAAGNVTWADGGTFQFELNDADGTAGSTTAGWDLLNPTTLDITAGVGQFTLEIVSLDALQQAGLAGNFNADNNYSWLFVDATSAITSFNANSFVLDTAGFTNSFTGTFSVVRGDTVGGDDSQLFITYKAVPEPSTWAMLVGGIGMLAFGQRIRRKMS